MKHFSLTWYGGEPLLAKNKKITAETVELKNCEVEKVECKKAFIDSNCNIKKLTAENYDISADSTIDEIIGNK